MKERVPYSYTVLRYLHDLTTGEFVNLGVVVHAPGMSFLASKMRRRYTRVTQFFPDAKGGALTKTLRALEHAINKAGETMRKDGVRELFAVPPQNALDAARCHLPVDDGALQWSPVLGGLTADPQATLDSLFERVVNRYDERPNRESRSDADVWREFSRALEVRRLDSHITEHQIRSPIDTVTFDKALKNGKWHLLEPVSFDLLDGSRIKSKANEIVGQMTVLRDANEDFDIYLLVGEPRNPEVQKDYAVAMKTLERIPVEKRVFTEREVDAFGLAIEKAMAEPPHETESV